MLKLAAENRALLDRVNREVNRMPYRVDHDRYGQAEFWTEIDAKGGDCEDFALAKRARLLAAGIALDCLKLAVCRDENGECHAVLTVDTDQGTLVLDNRFPSIRHFERLPYQWVSRQHGRSWVKIESEASA